MSNNSVVPAGRLWNIKEAAAYLGVAIGTLYQWVSRNKYSADPVPTIHLSKRCLRFPADKLIVWAERRADKVVL